MTHCQQHGEGNAASLKGEQTGQVEQNGCYLWHSEPVKFYLPCVPHQYFDQTAKLQDMRLTHLPLHWQSLSYSEKEEEHSPYSVILTA